MAAKADNRSKDRLSRPLILKTALGLAQDQGFDISMRQLAEALSVWPMALYRYFDNREDLELAMVDSILGEIIEQPQSAWLARGASDDWQKDITDFAKHLFSVLTNYPGAAQALLFGRLTSVNSQKIVIAAIDILRSVGLSERRSVEVFQTIGSYLLNAAMLEDARRKGLASSAGIVDPENTTIDERARGYFRQLAEIHGEERLVAGLTMLLRSLEEEVGPLD
ncbi:MAG: helix-turn-helix domain-containing protein [Pseudomonadota bacterium]